MFVCSYASYLAITHIDGFAIFGLLGLTIAALGAWSLLEPLSSRWRARQTYYAITDKRVLIIKRNDGFEVHSVFGHEFNHYSRRDTSDGNGSIRFRVPIGKNGIDIFLKIRFADSLSGVDDVKGADI